MSACGGGVRVYVFFFFFSSRRRHTRCSRDWSSDVCSSDLDLAGAVALYGGPFLDGFYLRGSDEFERWAETERGRLAKQVRSGERRGGEEWRSRWSPYHLKKKRRHKQKNKGNKRREN